ncbi:Cornichon [Quillaja saponaria]|nr:Cornichon [Quillaja saponaria]
MCLVDVEFDYINPYDSASRINKIVLPEFFIQGVLCFILLISGYWFMFLISLPYLCYNVRLYMRKQYLVDVTEIYNQLKQEKMLRFIKISYLIVLFVISLIWLILSIEVDQD